MPGYGYSCCCAVRHCETQSPTDTLRSTCIPFEYHWVLFSYQIDPPATAVGDCPTTGVSHGNYLCVFDAGAGEWNFTRTGRSDGVEIRLQFTDLTDHTYGRKNVRLTRVEVDDNGSKFVATWDETNQWWAFDPDQVCRKLCTFAPFATMNVSALIFEESALTSQSWTVAGSGWVGAAAGTCCEGFNGSKTLAGSDGTLAISADVVDERVVGIQIYTPAGFTESYGRGDPCVTASNFRIYEFRAYRHSSVPGCSPALIADGFTPPSGYSGRVGQSDSLAGGGPALIGQTYIDELAGDYLSFAAQSPLLHQTSYASCPTVGEISVS